MLIVWSSEPARGQYLLLIIHACLVVSEFRYCTSARKKIGLYRKPLLNLSFLLRHTPKYGNSHLRIF